MLRHAAKQAVRSLRVEGGGFLGGTDPNGADDRIDTVELRFYRRRVEYVGGNLRQVLVLRPQSLGAPGDGGDGVTAGERLGNNVLAYRTGRSCYQDLQAGLLLFVSCCGPVSSARGVDAVEPRPRRGLQESTRVASCLRLA